MSSIKADLFEPGPILSVHKRSSAKSDNFLEKIVSGNVGARLKANAMKVNTGIMVAATRSKLDPERLTALTASITLRALEELGFDVGSPEVLADGPGPVFARSAAEIVARLGGELSDEAGIERAAAQAVKAMASVSRNAVLARFAQNAYPQDLDIRTALNMSMTGALSAIAVRVNGFSFTLPPQKVLKSISETIAKAVVEHAERYVEGAGSTPSKVMLIQSLMQNAADIYGACYDAERMRVEPLLPEAIRVAGEDEIKRKKLHAFLSARLPAIESKFNERLAETVQLSNEHSGKLFETLFQRARQDARPAA